MVSLLQPEENYTMTDMKQRFENETVTNSRKQASHPKNWQQNLEKSCSCPPISDTHIGPPTAMDQKENGPVSDRTHTIAKMESPALTRTYVVTPVATPATGYSIL